MAKQDSKAKQDDVTVRLTAPYAFHDAEGAHHWHAGQSVSGDEAWMLIERGAPVEEMS